MFSYSVMSCSLGLHGLQHARLPCLHYLLEFAQTHVHWVNDAIQPSHPLCPLLLLPLIFPASRSFSMSWLFPWAGQSIGVSARASVFQWTFRIDCLQDWLVWSPCSPRDSRESSLAPQFKGINSLAFSLLYGPTLTSVHDYWKNHSFEHRDLCRQSYVSAFEYAV